VLIAVAGTRFGGAHRHVLEVTNDCSAAVEAIGEDIRQPLMALDCGSTEVRGSQGRASWSLVVAGSEGSGRLSYMADKAGDEWSVLLASLEVDERWIGVVPCTGEISEQDARGEMTEGLLAEGTVLEARGAAPVARDDRCELEVLRQPDYPDKQAFNCQVRVRCNGRAIYGDSEHNGYVLCAVRDGRPEMALDVGGTAANSDPMLEMNISEKRVVVADDDPTRYSFTVALD